MFIRILAKIIFKKVSLERTIYGHQRCKLRGNISYLKIALIFFVATLKQVFLLIICILNNNTFFSITILLSILVISESLHLSHSTILSELCSPRSQIPFQVSSGLAWPLQFSGNSHCPSQKDCCINNINLVYKKNLECLIILFW